MLNTIERRQEIIKQVYKIGRVAVTTLAQKFEVSTVTIRTDLNILAQKELLVRSRGGAVAISEITKELSIKEDRNIKDLIKQKLALEAVKLVNDNELILLDSCAETDEIAKQLNNHENLVVMTNGLDISNELAHVNNIEVLMTGGTLRKKSLSLYGRQAEMNIANLKFDKVILGVDGIEFTSGLSSHFEHKASLNSQMCNVSKEVIVVAESSKFDRCGFHTVADLTAVNVLITDSNIPKAYQDYFESLNVKLIIVDEGMQNK